MSLINKFSYTMIMVSCLTISKWTNADGQTRSFSASNLFTGTFSRIIGVEDIFQHEQNLGGFRDDFGFPPYPIDVQSTIPWDHPGFSITTREQEQQNSYVYSDETGRVRTRARTGLDPESNSNAANQSLFWNGVFVRDSSDLPSFILNRSWIELQATAGGERRQLKKVSNIGNNLLNNNNVEAFSPPYAGMEITVDVYKLNPDGSPYRSLIHTIPYVFKHRSEVSGMIGHPLKSHRLKLPETETDGFASELLLLDLFGNVMSTSVHPAVIDVRPQYLYTRGTCSRAKDRNCIEWRDGRFYGLRYEIPSYTEKLPLNFLGIRQGNIYSVWYDLMSTVGEDSAEQFAESVLGDPLDNSIGGFELATLDTPADSTTQVCNKLPDVSRFVVNSDGTATDMHTGLMWQRCPVGFLLDENGTPSTLEDDRCNPDSTTDYIWQTSLQTANTDSFAGFNDWYLPNIKELESISLVSCQTPSINRYAFPDTGFVPYWSSTSVLNGQDAWQVNFTNGVVFNSDKSSQAKVRLARQSGISPVRPTPGLIVQAAQITEPESGTEDMKFVLTISRPALTDVVVNYDVRGLTGTENIDFTPDSSSITIPSGQVTGVINVPVNADNDVEPAESIELEISNLSGDAYLAMPSVLGVILDNEPHVYFRQYREEVQERLSGSQLTNILVQLDRPATNTVTVDYSTANGSANSGSDYSASTGTVTFNTGQQEAVISIPINGDIDPENDETFTVTLSNPVGVHLLDSLTTATVTIMDDDSPFTLFALNDTGATRCADSVTAGLTCPQTDHPGQDAEFGRDVTDNDPNDGEVGFVFTKLDNSGNPLPRSANSWDCVRDEVTGLIWETKKRDVNDLRHYLWTYSWYNSTGINDGGAVGTENGGTCLDTANCDTEKYVAAINTMNLCGFNDWRLPTVDEALSLGYIDWTSNINLHGIDAIYFPNVTSDPDGPRTWTNTPDASDTTRAWNVELALPNPSTVLGDKAADMTVRLVRGVPAP